MPTDRPTDRSHGLENSNNPTNPSCHLEPDLDEPTFSNQIDASFACRERELFLIRWLDWSVYLYPLLASAMYN